MDERVSIGQVKRDISELVNRVAFGGQRIILTSRGKPKAALVSIEDYQKLEKEQPPRLTQQLAWMHQTRELSTTILMRRGGKPIDVDEIIAAGRADLEGRGEWMTDSD